MKTHRKTRVALAVAGAAALVAAGSAAYAHSPWVVAAGGVTTGTVAYTTTATGTSSNPAVAFTAGAAHMTCESASSSGDVFLGTTGTTPPGGPTPPVGYYSNIQGITFDTCLAEGVLPMEVTEAATVANPWKVDITGDKFVPVPPDTRANRSPIQIYAIHAHIQDIGTAGGTCGMDVDGTVNGIVNSDDQKLEVLTADSGLVVSKVTGGCFGLTSNFDRATFAGVFDVANAVGPITFDH